MATHRVPPQMQGLSRKTPADLVTLKDQQRACTQQTYSATKRLGAKRLAGEEVIRFVPYNLDLKDGS